MHSQNPPILHLDIKPDNVLYDSQGRIKLCDFGFSTWNNEKDNTYTQPTGSPLFMSPEMLRATSTSPANITEKTDVYSFSILLWEILTRKKAFQHHSMHGSFKHFRQAILVGERPPLPTNCIPALKSLLVSCWDVSPDKRPTFKEIVHQLGEIMKEYEQIELQQEISVEDRKSVV